MSLTTGATLNTTLGDKKGKMRNTIHLEWFVASSTVALTTINGPVLRQIR